jgi:hypothetical protein
MRTPHPPVHEKVQAERGVRWEQTQYWAH